MLPGILVIAVTQEETRVVFDQPAQQRRIALGVIDPVRHVRLVGKVLEILGGEIREAVRLRGARPVVESIQCQDLLQHRQSPRPGIKHPDGQGLLSARAGRQQQDRRQGNIP